MLANADAGRPMGAARLPGWAAPMLLAALTAPLLSGCVAAAVPVAAAGAIVQNQRAKTAYRKARARIARQQAEYATGTSATRPLGGSKKRRAGTLSGQMPSDADRPNSAVPPITDAPPPLAGADPSGAGFIIGPQAGYDRIVAYVDAKVKARRTAGTTEGPERASVVLAPLADPARPLWTQCAAMPPAVLVDLDVGPAPVAPADQMLADALDAIRGAGAKVIYVATAPPQARTALATDLMVTGLGPAEPGDSLFFLDDTSGQTKDALRWKIASRQCIVAMIGGDNADFSDLFSRYARAPDTNANAILAARMAGAGWFTLRPLGGEQ